MVYMFLNGGGMRGGPAHHHIAGTPYLGEVTTAARYRFFAVGHEFPGLWPVGEGGRSIAGELYDVPLEVLRDGLLPDEPAELELGVIELADGGPSLAMLLRRGEHDRRVHRDITAYRGWRAYLRSGEA
ncbi:MAG: allophanate hydrolase-related protein [Carbonactinosporaceae bacterium]